MQVRAAVGCRRKGTLHGLGPPGWFLRGTRQQSCLCYNLAGQDTMKWFWSFRNPGSCFPHPQGLTGMVERGCGRRGRWLTCVVSPVTSDHAYWPGCFLSIFWFILRAPCRWLWSLWFWIWKRRLCLIDIFHGCLISRSPGQDWSPHLPDSRTIPWVIVWTCLGCRGEQTKSTIYSSFQV